MVELIVAAIQVLGLLFIAYGGVLCLWNRAPPHIAASGSQPTTRKASTTRTLNRHCRTGALPASRR